MLKTPVKDVSSSIIGWIGPDKTCTFPGCFRPRRTPSSDVCMAHHQQRAKGRQLAPIGSSYRDRTRPRQGTCSQHGCDAPAVAFDLCASHYQQRRRGRPLTPIKRRKEQAT